MRCHPQTASSRDREGQSVRAPRGHQDAARGGRARRVGYGMPGKGWFQYLRFSALGTAFFHQTWKPEYRKDLRSPVWLKLEEKAKTVDH